MSRADNSRHLLQAAAARRNNARHKASQAIERLDRQGEPITFAAVADVSRSWLYRQHDLRDLIDRSEPAKLGQSEPPPSSEPPTPPYGNASTQPETRSFTYEPRTPNCDSDSNANSANSASDAPTE